MQTAYLNNSDQVKDFIAINRDKKIIHVPTNQSWFDNLSAKLSSLAKRSLGNVEEGLHGMNDTDDTKKLRGEFDNTIKQINSQYANTVLETGSILDKFDKKVSAQEQVLIDAVKDFKWRKVQDEQRLNSLAGRKEDSAIYERMGSSKYFVYTLIALIVLGLTMTHVNLDFNAYMFVSLILTSVFIFILTYFYWKKSIYNTS